MKRFAVMALVALSASGCGSLASNTDVPQGVYLGAGDKPDIADDPGVRVIEGPSPTSGVPIAGTSCKNKLWEAEPTREKALMVLKREARKAGMNAVYLQSVGVDPAALAKNCWAAITATGVAVKL